jgi:hypothetical protein
VWRERIAISKELLPLFNAWYKEYTADPESDATELAERALWRLVDSYPPAMKVPYTKPMQVGKWVGRYLRYELTDEGLVDPLPPDSPAIALELLPLYNTWHLANLADPNSADTQFATSALWAEVKVHAEQYRIPTTEPLAVAYWIKHRLNYCIRENGIGPRKKRQPASSLPGRSKI